MNVPIRSILLATDFSKPSDYAFRLAQSLARDGGARLIVLHVMPVPLVQQKSGYREEMAAELNRVEAPDRRISLERRLVEGDPVNEILRVARETNCDLVVMGTHGRTGLRRMLMGSVAEQVVRRAPCLVLTVKTFVPEPQKDDPATRKRASPAGTVPGHHQEESQGRINPGR